MRTDTNTTNHKSQDESVSATVAGLVTADIIRAMRMPGRITATRPVLPTSAAEIMKSVQGLVDLAREWGTGSGSLQNTVIRTQCQILDDEPDGRQKLTIYGTWRDTASANTGGSYAGEIPID